MKILILASNPRKDLNLNEEIRDLQSVIERSRHREQFEVEVGLAVRPKDLQGLLLRYEPQIVHFCGHGTGKQGLVLQDEFGKEQVVSTAALKNFFELFAERVECVLLNACYSETQADAIVEHINYVIGMSQEIFDTAAIAFATGFYGALGFGRSIEESYKFGCNQIHLTVSDTSNVARRSMVSDEQRKLEVADVLGQAGERIKLPEYLKPQLKQKTRSMIVPDPRGASSSQSLSSNEQVDLQLTIDRAYDNEIKLKQYRDRVREFLADRKLTPLETIRLERLRENLGLSEAEANRILEEEQEPIRKARDEYKAVLIGLIEAGHYPLDAETEKELQSVQQELGLSNVEVKAIEAPILVAAEEDHQAKVEQEKQQEYQQKLQRYEQEFRKAIENQYPIISSVRDGLRNLQQSLGLSDEDTVRIEEPLAVSKEAEYQQHLAEEQRSQEEAKRRLGLERQQALERRREEQQREYQAKLQQYEQEFAKTIGAEYPIGRSARYRLISFRQSLGLRDTDVSQIEEALIALKEAAHQQQWEQGQQGKQKQEPEIELQRQPEKQQRQQEYQINLQRYEQEFRKAIETEYPIQPKVRNILITLQQSLSLCDADIYRIEAPITSAKQAAYFAVRQAAYQLIASKEEAQQQRLNRKKEQAAHQREAARLKQQEQPKPEADKKRKEQAKQPSPDGLKGNYAQLEALLKAGKWQGADRETDKQMCQVMGRQQEGWLREEDIKQFPYADLREIDRLWVKYSKGKFGLSIQKQIWQECGSPTVYDENWEKFGDRVGWRTKGFLGLNKDWVTDKQLNFDDTSAPPGHLPHCVLASQFLITGHKIKMVEFFLGGLSLFAQ